MERKANYALVGFASLALFIGMVIFVVWLARIQFSQKYELYDVVFQGPIMGLSEGGEVHFNGIKVGSVTKIALDKNDPTKVVARVSVTADVPIRVDSYATLEPQGITGVSYVQITAGTPSKPLLEDTVPKGQTPIIPGRPGALSSLLQGGGSVLQATLEAVNRVNRLLSDNNINNLSGAISDIHAITAEARRRKQLFADADNAVNSINTAAASIQRVGDSANELVNGDGKRTFHEAADAAAEIKAAAAEARALVAKLQGPTGDFATNGLPQLTAAVGSLQQTADSLRRLSDEIQQDPRALLTKAPAKEVQVKP
jgi:phospholipid/cholesterol/gamma-HCH transport system substrate-binding protein